MMPFDISTLSRLLAVRPVCRFDDGRGVGCYIVDNAAPIDGGRFDLRYRIYALIKHRRRRDKYELSLRAYEYDSITGGMFRRDDVIPPRWQTAQGDPVLAVRLLRMLAEGEVVFCGRPSEYNTSGIVFNPEYPAEQVRALAGILSELDAPAAAHTLTALAPLADA